MGEKEIDAEIQRLKEGRLTRGENLWVLLMGSLGVIAAIMLFTFGVFWGVWG